MLLVGAGDAVVSSSRRAKLPSMSDNPQPGSTAAPKPASRATTQAPVLHRVCVQCNNVFRVPPDKFDAKQCPNCHKG